MVYVGDEMERKPVLVLPCSAFGSVVSFVFFIDLDWFDGAEFAANQELQPRSLRALLMISIVWGALVKSLVYEDAQVLGHLSGQR